MTATRAKITKPGANCCKIILNEAIGLMGGGMW